DRAGRGRGAGAGRDVGRGELDGNEALPLPLSRAPGREVRVDVGIPDRELARHVVGDVARVDISPVEGPRLLAGGALEVGCAVDDVGIVPLEERGPGPELVAARGSLRADLHP